MDETLYRWAALILLAANISISRTLRHRARVTGGVIERAREGMPLMLLRVAIAVPVLALLLTYLVMPRWVAWSQISLPPVLRWTGGAAAAATAPLFYWVLTTLGPNVSETVLTKPNHQLVTSGLYRWVRHPLYGIGTIFLLALSCLTANWLLALFAVAGAAIIRRAIVPREERELIARFGDDYRAYRAATGAFLLRFPGFTP